MPVPLRDPDKVGIEDGDDVLINHPEFGSLWLADVEVSAVGDGRAWLVGWAEDRSVPEGRSVMNFPASCARKVSTGRRLPQASADPVNEAYAREAERT